MPAFVAAFTKQGQTLFIGVQRTEPDEGNDAAEGWLLALWASKDQLEGITEIDARVTATVYPDHVFPSGELVRVYAFIESEDVVHPCVSLYDDGTFLFNFSVLSSYIGYGTYTIENDRLTLSTEDGNYTYVFNMVDDTLVFEAKASSEMVWVSNLYDGAILK